MAVEIRTYVREDRRALEELAIETSCTNDSKVKRLEDIMHPEFYFDIEYAYHLDYEPESILIAEDNGQLVGYLTGCVDVRRYERTMAYKIVPEIAFKLFIGEYDMKTAKIVGKALKHPIQLCRAGPTASFFHINIAGGYRGQGIGKELVERYLEYLKKSGQDKCSVGIFSGNERALRFFSKNSFVETRRNRFLDWEIVNLERSLR